MLLKKAEVQFGRCDIELPNGNSPNWCKDNEGAKNICDGSKKDCLEKGKMLCDNSTSCFGIMYHAGGWSQSRKGVSICKSPTLVQKGDWQVYEKTTEDRR